MAGDFTIEKLGNDDVAISDKDCKYANNSENVNEKAFSNEIKKRKIANTSQQADKKKKTTKQTNSKSKTTTKVSDLPISKLMTNSTSKLNAELKTVIKKNSESSSNDASMNLSSKKNNLNNTTIKNRVSDKTIKSPSEAVDKIISDPKLYLTKTKPDIYEITHGSCPNVKNQTWESFAEIILNELEKFEYSAFFKYPVDPVQSGLTDYYEKVIYPIDLETVRRKLNNNMYSHPFRWQHDVRSIFFCAFSYYPEFSHVWSAAAECCVFFENLCKKFYQVNPYATYQFTLQTNNEEVGKNITNQDEVAEIRSNKILNPTRPINIQKKNKIKVPPGVQLHEHGIVVYTADCYGTPLANYYENYFPTSALPKPCSMPSSSIDLRTNLGISSAQKKNVPARFKELDVTYRLALLEWLKDELGIHPLLCALDIRYVPEFDLIPLVKARKFFLYMKALLCQQQAAQEQEQLTCTLATTLDWYPNSTQISSNIGISIDSNRNNLNPELSSDKDMFALDSNNVANNQYIGSSMQRITNQSSISDSNDKQKMYFDSNNNQNDWIDNRLSNEESYSSEILSSSDSQEIENENDSNISYYKFMYSNLNKLDLSIVSSNNTEPSSNVQAWQKGKQNYGLGLWKKPSSNEAQTKNQKSENSHFTSWGEWKVKALQSEFKYKEKHKENEENDKDNKPPNDL